MAAFETRSRNRTTRRPSGLRPNLSPATPEPFTVSRKVEPRSPTAGNRIGAETGKGGVDLPGCAGGDVDHVSMKEVAQIRFVRYARAKAFQRGVLVAEGCKELEREALSVKGLFSKFGNGLFDLDSVHSQPHGLITSTPQPSKSRVLRVATGIPAARAIAAIWQSASGIGRPDDRRPAAISA